MLDILHLVATFAIGLLAGALLMEACILVPYWRRMPVAEFSRLHHQLGPSLFRFFAPITAAAVLLSVVSAITDIAANGTNVWRNFAAGLCPSALLIFFIYFKKTNNKFAEQSIPIDEIPAELQRWATWHWFRTAIVLVAFACSIRAAYV